MTNPRTDAPSGLTASMPSEVRSDDAHAPFKQNFVMAQRSSLRSYTVSGPCAEGSAFARDPGLPSVQSVTWETQLVCTCACTAAGDGATYIRFFLVEPCGRAGAICNYAQGFAGGSGKPHLHSCDATRLAHGPFPCVSDAVHWCTCLSENV